MARKRIDITGQRFGRLTAVHSHSIEPGGPSVWLFKCDCGNEKVIRASVVTQGKSTSCGCFQKEETAKRGSKALTTHGLSHVPEYKIWAGMIDRCYNSHRKEYPRYGGRGISVCERWQHSFENFYADMGVRPSKVHSVDRINNDGNYEPGNCRWATPSEQNKNQRRRKPR